MKRMINPNLFKHPIQFLSLAGYYRKDVPIRNISIDLMEEAYRQGFNDFDMPGQLIKEYEKNPRKAFVEINNFTREQYISLVKIGHFLDIIVRKSDPDILESIDISIEDAVKYGMTVQSLLKRTNDYALLKELAKKHDHPELYISLPPSLGLYDFLNTFINSKKLIYSNGLTKEFTGPYEYYRKLIDNFYCNDIKSCKDRNGRGGYGGIHGGYSGSLLQANVSMIVLLERNKKCRPTNEFYKYYPVANMINVYDDFPLVFGPYIVKYTNFHKIKTSLLTVLMHNNTNLDKLSDVAVFFSE